MGEKGGGHLLELPVAVGCRRGWGCLKGGEKQLLTENPRRRFVAGCDGGGAA